MEEINLKDFWDYYKGYIVIVLLVTLFGIISIFLYDMLIKKSLYTTYTTVVLVKDTSDKEDDTISQSDVALNQKLVSTYREIIKSRLVLSQVISKLNINETVESLSKKINVQALSDTEILKISVTDGNPNNATNIANTIAEVFNTEIKQIYKISNVSVIDKAIVPISPSNNKLLRDMVLMGLLCFVGSSAVIFVIFYFDDTVRSVDDIEGKMGVSVISKIYKDENKVDLVVDKKPNALVSESIKTLRTNLQFAAVDQEIKTILITSSVPSEGKSYISANLAISFAQTGKKVLLIDCDLRRGRQHRVFKVDGREGLSNLLIGDITNSADFIFETRIKNLYIMPRGIVPPNPSELLNSKKNEALIKLLSKHFDVVILDGAPINGLSDSLILSSYVDCVLLVSSINHTPKTELNNTIKALQNVNANLIGVIANNVSNTHAGNRYYYYKSGDNYIDDDEDGKK